MKRRDFLLQSTSSAGLLLLNQAKAARPCPPILLEGGGGTVACSPQGAEEDWQARIAGPGVVWYHDFRNRAEVDNFRWTANVQNDPNDASGSDQGTVNWRTGDGITGGACLETLRKAGTNDGSNWWRPFSALTGAGNGRGVDDPAAAGSIALAAWAPTQGGSQTRTWDRGWYGNPDYQDTRFDGWDYYIQSRVKLDPHRPEEPMGGKLFYFTRCDKSLTSQEIVTKSLHNGSAVGNSVFFVYRSGGTPLANDPPGKAQPNSEYTGDDYWRWPFGQWVTVLYHVKGGRNGSPDTLFQVWVDWDGSRKVNDYIKIWDQPTVALPYDGAFPFGHNAVIASGYMNGANFSQDIWQRYDQIIFSTQPIPCPRF
jgi:hypothetical protein